MIATELNKRCSSLWFNIKPSEADWRRLLLRIFMIVTAGWEDFSRCRSSEFSYLWLKWGWCIEANISWERSWWKVRTENYQIIGRDDTWHLYLQYHGLKTSLKNLNSWCFCPQQNIFINCYHRDRDSVIDMFIICWEILEIDNIDNIQKFRRHSRLSWLRSCFCSGSWWQQGL